MRDSTVKQTAESAKKMKRNSRYLWIRSVTELIKIPPTIPPKMEKNPTHALHEEGCGVVFTTRLFLMRRACAGNGGTEAKPPRLFVCRVLPAQQTMAQHETGKQGDAKPYRAIGNGPRSRT